MVRARKHVQMGSNSSKLNEQEVRMFEREVRAYEKAMQCDFVANQLRRQIAQELERCTHV